MIEFDYNLKNILLDLNKYKRDRNQLLVKHINERLNKSLQSYYSELNNSFNYLKYKNELKLSRNINRYDVKCK